MKAQRLLLAVSFASSALFLCARPFATGNWPAFPKTLSIVLLAVIGFGVNRLLGAALALSAVGDFALCVQHIGNIGSDSLFLIGLVSFLLAHVVYIVMFRSFPVRWLPGGLRFLGIAAILLALGFLLRVLYPSLGPMRLPVIIYAFVLCGMGISAMLAKLGNPWAAVGGLCFVASDGMLAFSKFHAPFRWSEPLIWITYFIAQFLILEGICTQRRKPGVC